MCAPTALCILTTLGINRRPCSCLKPTLATCKWSAMRCEISTGRPDASSRPFPFQSEGPCVCSCICVSVWSCESERAGKAYICVPVCVRMLTDAGCLNARTQAGSFFCSLCLMDKATLDRAEPVRVVLFSAMLDSVRPGLAAQVLPSWSNYPVLCHPADELITASACFPLNLESQ